MRVVGVRDGDEKTKLVGGCTREKTQGTDTQSKALNKPRYSKTNIKGSIWGNPREEATLEKSGGDNNT